MTGNLSIQQLRDLARYIVYTEPSTTPSMYASLTLPDIDEVKYTKRIAKRLLDNNPHLLLQTYLLMIKFSIASNIPISQYNYHRVVFISALLIHKLWDDDIWSNNHISRIGGMSKNEIAYLERDYLRRINWCVPIEYDDTTQSVSYVISTLTGMTYDEYMLLTEIKTHPLTC
jgi:hypothetical protein